MRTLWILAIMGLSLSCQNEPPASTVAKTQDLSRDSVMVEIDTLRQNLGCDLEEPCVQIELQKLLLSPQNAVNTKISTHWNTVALELASPGELAFHSRQQAADSLVAEYERLGRETQPVPYPWELNQELSVLFNRNALLSLNLMHYSFTGGAHGNSYLLYGLYNLNTGNLLSLDSLMKPGQFPAFKSMAEARFRSKYSVAGNDYKKAGYWFKNNTFQLPQNYKYDGNELELIYNVYEIAPYSEGVLRLRFSLQELKTLLRTKFLPSPST